jgi:hypothetical protein
MKYIGPDYASNIILPGFHTPMDPRNWDDDTINQQISYNEQIIKYFSNDKNPNKTVIVTNPINTIQDLDKKYQDKIDEIKDRFWDLYLWNCNEYRKIENTFQSQQEAEQLKRILLTL